MKTSQGSECVTAGIRVKVHPEYLPGESSPREKRFLFAYTVTLFNEGSDTVQLLSRMWKIVDSEGEISVVRGDGVIGRQPTLAPAAEHEYSSYCPLSTSWGTMEGTYRFRRSESGEEFDVAVARFFLVAEATGQAATSK